MKTQLFWMRRDLRLHDNHALSAALKEGPTQVVFIFDPGILGKLGNPRDARVSFLWKRLQELRLMLRDLGSDLWVFYGQPLAVFQKLHEEEAFSCIFCNHDYEGEALRRDEGVRKWAASEGLEFRSFKDQVIFEKDEVLSQTGKAYTVFTPYKKRWLAQLTTQDVKAFGLQKENFAKTRKERAFPSLAEMGFEENTTHPIPEARLDPRILKNYARDRDTPGLDATSHLGLHLRFGTLSIRECVSAAQKHSESWLSELIWREFFMQILFHFPHVEKHSFRPEYDQIEWRQSSADFKRWQEGQTGYPLVDAGMRELRETGFMHNRVRMLTASFLCKHLLIYWYKGERYFASQLLDYDLAANNGNWQWAAGTGCDAAPYFRVFNPEIQLKKFDPDLTYVRRWVPEYGTKSYPEPIISHTEGRERALRVYAKGLHAAQAKRP